MDLDSLALRVKRSENLPVLSQVANTVLKIADDPRTGAKELERTIERDIALASKILKVANSPLYGQSTVNTISRAVSVLGMNTVKSLVVSLAYQQMISNRSQATKFKRTHFWSHSIGTAITSRVLCKMIQPHRTEELYLAGLMHDVGILVLDRFLPQQLDEAIRYSEENRKPLYLAEKEVLGYDHAQVGGLLAEQWGLSGVISHAVAFHHNVQADTLHADTTAIITVANNLCHLHGIHNQDGDMADTSNDYAQELLGITGEQLEVIGAVMIQEVQKAQSSFAIPDAA